MGKSKKPPNKFEALFQHGAFQAVFSVAALVLAYIFVSWAIDSGSLLDYAIALLLVIVGIREILQAALKFIKGATSA